MENSFFLTTAVGALSSAVFLTVFMVLYAIMYKAKEYLEEEAKANGIRGILQMLVIATSAVLVCHWLGTVILDALGA